MKNYPVKRRPDGRGNPIQPYRPPNINVPASIMPRNTKFRDYAGQVHTTIHLKNARGEEMTIHQTQQIIDLQKGSTANFFVTDDNYGTYKRRKK